MSHTRALTWHPKRRDGATPPSKVHRRRIAGKDLSSISSLEQVFVQSSARSTRRMRSLAICHDIFPIIIRISSEVLAVCLQSPSAALSKAAMMM